MSLETGEDLEVEELFVGDKGRAHDPAIFKAQVGPLAQGGVCRGGHLPEPFDDPIGAVFEAQGAGGGSLFEAIEGFLGIGAKELGIELL